MKDTKKAISDLWLALEALKDYKNQDENGESVDMTELHNEVSGYIESAIRSIDDEATAED